MSIDSTGTNDFEISNAVNEKQLVQNTGDIKPEAVGRKWCLRILFAAVLILSTLYAYFPSLNMVFINDQLSYFLELDGETSLTSGLQLLDYGAQRQYNKGDEVLYRPLLFLCLSVENSFLKRNFKLWNAVNLGLHLFLVYLLFEMLWKIRPTSFAFGVAMTFGLLMSNFALVTSNHLSGYLIGYGLLLIALWAAREMGSVGENTGSRWFWIYGFAMTSAMLFHEIAVIASFAVIAYVSCCRWGKFDIRKERFIVALGAPLLIYAVLYSCHAWQCDRFLWIDPHNTNRSIVEFLLNISLLIVSWLQHIFLPVSGQMVFSFMNFSSWSLPDGAWVPQMILSGVLWIVILLCLKQGFERKHVKDSLPFTLLLLFVIVSYAMMNVVGRSSNTFQIAHYDFFPAFFGTVMLYSLIDFSRIRVTKITVAMICLLLITFYNGLEIRKNSHLVQEIYKPVASCLELVEQKVRPELSRPDFSFLIKELPPELDIRIKGYVGYPDQGNVVEMSLLNALYGKYYNAKNPTDIYVIKKIQPDKLDLLMIK